MKTLSSIISAFITLQTFGQSDYELLQSYLNKPEQNKLVASITELHLQNNKTWKKNYVQQFNLQGLPTLLIRYGEKDEELEKKAFIYDNKNHISKMETYKGGKHQGTAAFETNSSGQVISCTEYVYSSYDGEKMFLWKTIFDYYPNHAIEKSIRVEGKTKQDTVEINFYDTSGVKTKSLWNMGGLRTTKIEFIWNNDKSEMKELHCENDTTIYTTIVHKYKNSKEVERMDPSTSSQPFYWKYDSNGRIIETNEAFYYVTYNEYDISGRLKNKTWNVLFSDGPKNDLPKKFYFKYEYQLRK
jgi:hypothetical protein